MRIRTRCSFAIAGAAAAALWAAQQPLDKRVFASGYDDVELLGRAVRPYGRWRLIGWGMHLANGAAFGLAYSELRRRTPSTSPHLTVQAMVQAENLGLYPLAALVDRYHPAHEDMPRAFGRRQLLQATWRHTLFGALLGAAASRLPRD